MGESKHSFICVNQNILEMEYAVRGPIPKRAAELRKQGMKTISCNIGNPQALGQRAITYYRQVLSLVEDPSAIARERLLRKIEHENPEEFKNLNLISEYVLDFSEDFLTKLATGLGAYSDSNGPLFIREAVARYINLRDGFDTSGKLAANPENIFITNGASEAARYIINLLIAGKNDGIMIPIPQYPLYSATIRQSGGVQVNYYPEEELGWTFNKAVLEKSLQAAQKKGVNVKGIVVINPANPTGAILDEQTMRDVVAFAKENNIVIIADEVYQENTYGAEWMSFAKIVSDEDVPLFSLHSVSKGFYGECGHRGGYLEVRNPPKADGANILLTEIILKQASVSLCSNTVGQLLVYLIANPPKEDSEPCALFMAEKNKVLQDLYDKATMIREGFRQMDSMECFGRTGAMYLFPRIGKMPKGRNDFDYCMALLEDTGICTVNGAGFGQKEGTHHLRIAFLPPKELLEKVLPKWIDFHNRYVNQ